MGSFSDYFVIFVLALILFGPKKLPELARQLGKLMGEFRRASNEFKMQMEEELRASDRAEQERKLAALKASTPAEPVASALPYGDDGSLTPIAESGELSMNPPETGLPVAAVEAPEPTLEPALEPALVADAAAADAVNALLDSVPAQTAEIPAETVATTKAETPEEQAKNV